MKILKVFKLFSKIRKENKRLRDYMDMRDKENLLRYRNYDDMIKIAQNYNFTLEMQLVTIQKLYENMNGVEVQFNDDGVNLLRKSFRKDKNIVNFPKRSFKVNLK